MTRPTSPGAQRGPRQRKPARPVSDTAARQAAKRRTHLSEVSTGTAPVSWWRSSRKQLLAAVAAIATVLGVVSSGTALFDWFGSKVNPATPPPAKIDSRLTPPTLLSTHEALGSYLATTNQSAAGLSAFELAEPGFEFLIRIHLQGDQGRRLLLRWSVIDSKTGSPLPGSTYNQDAAVLRPRGPDQERQWPIWLPSPPRRGKFVLRATLIDENEMHRPVDETDSKPFTLTKAPSA